MPPKNDSPRVALKVGLVVAIVAVAAVVAFFWLRESATVVVVYRGNAVDAVAGSVVVHADGDLKELKSEASGRVESCERLDLFKPFKKGDVLVELDTTEQQRAIAQATRDYEMAQKRLEVVFSDNPEWIAARGKLDEAQNLRQAGDPAAGDGTQLQNQLDDIERRTNLRRIAAEENLKNAERLHDRGDLADVEFERQRRALASVDKELRLAAFDNAKARADHAITMENTRLQLNKMKILAPEAGTASAVMVWPGALINSGATVATFYSTSRVVAAKISEEDFAKIRLGQPAKVRLLIYGTETPFDAKVSRIVATADPDTQRYTVLLDVAVDPVRLVPYSTGQVNITVGEHPNVPLIPRRAVFEGENIYVVKGGRVERRVIKLGYASLNTVEVAEGLTVGEQVISENVRQFHDGQHVRVSVLH